MESGWNKDFSSHYAERTKLPKNALLRYHAITNCTSGHRKGEKTSNAGQMPCFPCPFSAKASLQSWSPNLFSQHK